MMMMTMKVTMITSMMTQERTRAKWKYRKMVPVAMDGIQTTASQNPRIGFDSKYI